METRSNPSAVRQEFAFAVTPEAKFTIIGQGFSTNGTVIIGGLQAPTTEWGAGFIAGRVPTVAKSGRVVVEVHAAGTVKRGEFTV